MQPYQLRVVEERVELNEKLVKLIKFTDSELYRALPNKEQSLLLGQQKAMLSYSHMLAERIALFDDD